ncbi:MAG: hypothetical protein ACJ77B_07800 [Chloroflexota bacterium]
MRSKPGTGTGSVKLEPLLKRNDAAFVIRGPVAASGYEWYLVAPMDEGGLGNQAPPRLGWVAAAAKDGAPWLTKRAPACAANALGYGSSPFDWPPGGLEGLDCLGSRTQKFMAGIGRAEDRCDLPPHVAPYRFDPCSTAFVLVDPDVAPANSVPLPLVLDPSVDLPELDALPPGSFMMADVTGQYDQAAARTCRAARGSQDADPPELVVLACRATFVVTSLTLVADP